MSHEQISTIPEQSDEITDEYIQNGIQELEDYANNPENNDDAIEEIENNGELPREAKMALKLGAIALEEQREASEENDNELTDEEAKALEEEIKRREAYRDKEFPNGKKIMIGGEEYMVTGVNFHGDDGKYETDSLTIQHMSAGGETLTLTPKELRTMIATAEALAIAR